MKRSAIKESPVIRAYREFLGVTKGASGEELKKAYHRLALLYHPDRNPGVDTSADFQRVREAFRVLSDSAQVNAVNQGYLRQKLGDQVIAGLNVSFGSFFGYRSFAAGGARVARARRIGLERAHERDVDPLLDGVLERDQSILDAPAYDALEVVYAGKFTVGDEARLSDGLSSAGRLPWVVLNNQGILHFLDGDVARARRCYAELNERVPNNIIFMYRLGLCMVLEGFQNPVRTWLGGTRPDPKVVDEGLRLFRRAIRLGETRTIGKQKCLLIRKFMADVLEKMGRRRRAARVWREILDLDPRSVEATLRVKGRANARGLLRPATKNE